MIKHLNRKKESDNIDKMLFIDGSLIFTFCGGQRKLVINPEKIAFLCLKKNLFIYYMYLKLYSTPEMASILLKLR